MSNPSWEAKRPPKLTGEGVGDKCPKCETGRLELVDDVFLSCDECGYDVVIPSSKGEDE